MTTSTFGPGDYGGYNNWAKSGVNTFWTNWNTSTFGTGTLGRITAIACRWDEPTSICNNAGDGGHNTLWNTGNGRVAQSGFFTVSHVGDGSSETMHNSATSDVWQSSVSYYIGFSRSAAHCSIFGFTTGAHGGYAGKSADDSTNSGGTSGWGGSGNGGLPGYGTVTVSNLYVRRGGAWTRLYFKTRRSAAWNGPEYVRVRRSGAWTITNWLQEHHIPSEGMPVEVNLGEYWEPGWLTEEGEKSWFGSIDPTTQAFDWTKPGDYEWKDKPWTGRYNSFDSDEVAEERLRAEYEWDLALRNERYQEAKIWQGKFEPSPPLEAEELATSMACGC